MSHCDTYYDMLLYDELSIIYVNMSFEYIHNSGGNITFFNVFYKVYVGTYDMKDIINEVLPTFSYQLIKNVPSPNTSNLILFLC